MGSLLRFPSVPFDDSGSNPSTFPLRDPTDPFAGFLFAPRATHPIEPVDSWEEGRIFAVCVEESQGGLRGTEDGGRGYDEGLLDVVGTTWKTSRRCASTMPKGTPLPHVSTLKEEELQQLSRDALRWYFKQMGCERPSWQKEVLLEGMKQVVDTLHGKDEEEWKKVEQTHGIVLPKPGETTYYMDQVMSAKNLEKKNKEGDPDATGKKQGSTEKDKKEKKTGDDQETKAWLEGLTFEEKEALRKAEARRRGMEKRKCSNCGNYARSKCEFMCCKKCCVEKNNPCKIHVLPPPETTPKVAQIVKPNAKFQEQPRTINLTGTKANKLRDLREVLEYYQKDMASIIQWREELNQTTVETEEAEADEAMERYLRNAKWMQELMHPKLDLPTVEHTSVEEIKSRFPMPSDPDAPNGPDARSQAFQQNFVDEFGKLLQQLEHASTHDALERCAAAYAEVTGHPLQLGPPTPWKRPKLDLSSTAAERSSTAPVHVPGSLGFAKVEDPADEGTVAGFLQARHSGVTFASL